MKATTVRVQEALAYQNPAMVSRYAKRHNVSIETAQALFEDCKLFLVEASRTKKEMSPTEELDEMWHFFILHTQDYHDFCHRHFGKFIHHIPSDAVETSGGATQVVLMNDSGKALATCGPCGSCSKK